MLDVPAVLQDITLCQHIMHNTARVECLMQQMLNSLFPAAAAAAAACSCCMSCGL
jgi:hypothetical protein